MHASVQTGLDCCLADPPAILRGAKLGLLMNQASVDRRFRYACDLLSEKFPGQLAALLTGLAKRREEALLGTLMEGEDALGLVRELPVEGTG